MANEFIIRKGFKSQEDSEISGSLNISGSIYVSNPNSQLTGSFTGSFTGDGSGLIGVDSGSWDGVYSGSAEITGSLRITGSLDTTGDATFSGSVTAGGKGIFETNTTVGNDGTYTGYASVGLGGTTNGFNRVFGGVGTADGLFLASATGTGIYFRPNGGTADLVAITSGGNVGIGTSPSTVWSTSYNALQIGLGGSIYAHKSAGSAMRMAANVVYEGTAPNYYDKYLTTSTATKYEQDAGNHIWSTAGSGSINTAISWSERMRIDGTTGNVGIGTGSTIYADLEIKRASEVTVALHNSSSITSGNRGNISFYNSSVSTVALIKAVADTDNVGTALEFYTRPVGGSLTNSLTISSGGAATFSRSPMTTEVSYDYKNIRVTSGFGGGYTVGRIQSLLAGYDVNIYGVDMGYSYNGSGYNLSFSTNDDLTGNPIERLTISSDGVATFTKSWGSNLPVLKAGNTANSIASTIYDTAVIQADDVTSIRIRERNTSTTDQEMGFSVGDGNASITSTENIRFYTGATAGNMIYNGQGGVNAMTLESTGAATFSSTITTSGEVQSPRFTAGTYPYNSILGSGADASTTIVEAGSTTGYRSAIKVNGGGSASPNTMQFITTSYERMSINNVGQVYINNACRVAGLYITALQGNAQLTNASTSSGSNPSYIGQGLISVSVSDIKAKENIGNVEDNECLNQIKSLANHVKKFDWKDKDWKKEKGRTIGMVAQEIYEEFPQHVHKPKNYEDEGWAIRYQEIVPILTKAIQEQQTIIEDLKARIETLEG